MEKPPCKINELGSFYYGEDFFDSLEDFLETISEEYDTKAEAVFDLDDDWNITVVKAEVEPLFIIDQKKLCSILLNQFDERLWPEFGDTDILCIENALKESVDFEKLTSLLPKVTLPTKKKVTITKQTLLDYLC